MNSERFSVLTDVHALYDVVARAGDAELAHGNRLIFAGDTIDGPDTKHVLDYIVSLGDHAIAIAGNHEWVLRNALSHNALAAVWRDEVWSRYHNRVLESYGLPVSTWRDNQSALRETLSLHHHLAWLQTLPSYIATDELVVVHAGPIPSTPWHRQQTVLDGITDKQRLVEKPPQLFSADLASRSNVEPVVDHRLFVTGHSHLDVPLEQRRGNQRIRLASKLASGAALYVWRHDEQRVITYEQ